MQRCDYRSMLDDAMNDIPLTFDENLDGCIGRRTVALVIRNNRCYVLRQRNKRKPIKIDPLRHS